MVSEMLGQVWEVVVDQPRELVEADLQGAKEVS